jgi:glycine/D-amino acid oxidase-like deaminating enzyme
LGGTLCDDVEADVCIVGGGYTGLWTAWGLLTAEPGLRVAIVEAEFPGFGASGRNGGWLSGLLPGNRDLLAAGPGGRDGVIALQRQLIGAVGSVVQVCEEEGIDADVHLGGTLAVARTGPQMARLRKAVDTDAQWGLGPEDISLLDRAEVDARVRVAGARGGVFSPHCARVQPAKLARGLGSAVARRGAAVYERSPVESISPRRVATRGGSVSAPWVVLATEGYTAGLPGQHRRLLPMNSSMVVTAPLTAAQWEAVGWSGCEAVRDGAHVYVYLQRTADDRIAIGGRGVPYRFGSRLGHSGDTHAKTVAGLASVLRSMFPAASETIQVEWAWSGVLGVARDWCPSVGVTAWPGSSLGGLARAGGYVGDGVATSHLAGLTLADLILGRTTARTALPWVGHRCRQWEPEPLRWFGVRGIYALYRAADRAEGRRPERGATSVWARVADRVSGRP